MRREDKDIDQRCRLMLRYTCNNVLAGKWLKETVELVEQGKKADGRTGDTIPDLTKTTTEDGRGSGDGYSRSDP